MSWSRLDLDDRFDLDGRIERERVCADRAARMVASIAKDLHEDVRRAIEDEMLLLEALLRCDDAKELEESRVHTKNFISQVVSLARVSYDVFF